MATAFEKYVAAMNRNSNEKWIKRPEVYAKNGRVYMIQQEGFFWFNDKKVGEK